MKEADVRRESTSSSPCAGGAHPSPGRPDGVSFVILLWLEPSEGTAEPEWRWRVRRAQTGEEACFRRLCACFREAGVRVDPVEQDVVAG